MTQQLGPLQQQWVDALRSGDYEQGKGMLHSISDKYCCLGVLCDIVEPGGWGTNGTNGTPQTHILRSAGLMTEALVDEFAYKGYEDLMYMNDHEGLTFTEIADSLEQDAARWFVESL